MIEDADGAEESVDDLARQARSGDRRAFGLLYDRFARKIHAYAFYRTYDRDAAEDLTATVFAKALERLSTFDPARGNFSAWIYGIARNAVIDHHRERSRVSSLDAAREGEGWDLPYEDSSEHDAELRDQYERLKPHLLALSAEQREIVAMRLWDELPYADIAAALGKSEGACKMAFSRAMAALRTALPLLLLAAALSRAAAGGR
jgi:RNA polymerase sigma-70 factor (ECF subfamily)